MHKSCSKPFIDVITLELRVLFKIYVPKVPIIYVLHNSNTNIVSKQNKVVLYNLLCDK